jgi:cytochrome c oxidase cbb3-type subunit III
MSEVKRTDDIAGDIVHEYDGIEEADNALPTWWIAVFVGSVVFATTYWLKLTGQVGEDELVSASQSSSLVASGKQAFMTNCVACHGPNAEGKIGPNLTDSNWLHGGAAAQIFGTIRDGVPAKGMPGWGPILGQDAIKSIAAYVLTLRNTNVPGKPPEGAAYSGS